MRARRTQTPVKALCGAAGVELIDTLAAMYKRPVSHVFVCVKTFSLQAVAAEMFTYEVAPRYVVVVHNGFILSPFTVPRCACAPMTPRATTNMRIPMPSPWQTDAAVRETMSLDDANFPLNSLAFSLRLCKNSATLRKRDSLLLLPFCLELLTRGAGANSARVWQHFGGGAAGVRLRGDGSCAVWLVHRDSQRREAVDHAVHRRGDGGVHVPQQRQRARRGEPARPLPHFASSPAASRLLCAAVHRTPNASRRRRRVDGEERRRSHGETITADATRFPLATHGASSAPWSTLPPLRW